VVVTASFHGFKNPGVFIEMRRAYRTDSSFSSEAAGSFRLFLVPLRQRNG